MLKSTKGWAAVGGKIKTTPITAGERSKMFAPEQNLPKSGGNNTSCIYSIYSSNSWSVHSQMSRQSLGSAHNHDLIDILTNFDRFYFVCQVCKFPDFHAAPLFFCKTCTQTWSSWMQHNLRGRSQKHNLETIYNWWYCWCPWCKQSQLQGASFACCSRRCSV